MGSQDRRGVKFHSLHPYLPWLRHWQHTMKQNRPYYINPRPLGVFPNPAHRWREHFAIHPLLMSNNWTDSRSETVFDNHRHEFSVYIIKFHLNIADDVTGRLKVRSLLSVITSFAWQSSHIKWEQSWRNGMYQVWEKKVWDTSSTLPGIWWLRINSRSPENTGSKNVHCT